MKRNEAGRRFHCAAAVFVFVLVAIGVVLTGCGSSAPRQVVSIAVTPPGGDAVEPMGTLPFVATGTFSQNPTLETVLTAQWSSSDPKVASIDATTGVATCLAPGGPVTIAASDAGVTGTGKLTCLSAPPARTGHCISSCPNGTCGFTGYCSGTTGNACTQSYDAVNCPPGPLINLLSTDVMSTDTCGQPVYETRSCIP